MARLLRASAGGVVYHIYNTAAPRKKLFRADADYKDFIEALAAASQALDTAVLGFCLMPDHFHLVVLPKRDGDLSRFMLRVVAAHIRNYRVRYRTAVGEKLFATRFRSFPVQRETYLLDALRVIESKPVRDGVARSPGRWKWSSFSHRAARHPLLDGSVKIPSNWERSLTAVDGKLTEAMETCLRRGRPWGEEAWTRRTADRLGLTSALRPIGRPRKVAVKKK